MDTNFRLDFPGLLCVALVLCVVGCEPDPLEPEVGICQPDSISSFDNTLWRFTYDGDKLTAVQQQFDDGTDIKFEPITYNDDNIAEIAIKYDHVTRVSGKDTIEYDNAGRMAKISFVSYLLYDTLESKWHTYTYNETGQLTYLREFVAEVDSNTPYQTVEFTYANTTSKNPTGARVVDREMQTQLLLEYSYDETGKSWGSSNPTLKAFYALWHRIPFVGTNPLFLYETPVSENAPLQTVAKDNAGILLYTLDFNTRYNESGAVTAVTVVRDDYETTFEFFQRCE